MHPNANTIHWLGAGLASVPGIRRLIARDFPLVLWERDLDRAREAVRGLVGHFQIREALAGALEEMVRAGDIVVSMLPASMHPDVARMCLDKGAHFVSSSYISPKMLELDKEAYGKGLSLVNEVGLDPGIDHLLAHLLVQDYIASPQYSPRNDHDFRSYCGGFPAVANDFKYKFSWSPLGVLKALLSPAQAICNGKIVKFEKPWDAVEDYPVDLAAGPERFQSYPNRDSLPFMKDYGFGSDWTVKRFVRGTLRLDGWADAWREVFSDLEDTLNREDDRELAALSDRLWADHAYQKDELDRVVLSVELKVERDGAAIWHKAKSLDSFGTSRSSAMGRLVSIPVSLAAEAVLKGQFEPGVQAAPGDPAMIRAWLETIAEHGDVVHHTDYCMMNRIEAAE